MNTVEDGMVVRDTYDVGPRWSIARRRVGRNDMDNGQFCTGLALSEEEHCSLVRRAQHCALSLCMAGDL
jgi:hypothetical protein